VASKHINLVVLDLLLKKEELLLLAPIAQGLDQTGKKDSDEDRGGVDPCDGITEEAQAEADETQEDEHLHVELIKLVPQDGEEGASFRQTAGIISEEFLSAIDVLHVADDSSLGIG